MLVDELLIPHNRGPIRVRLGERFTVFAGLDEVSRTRLTGFLVAALAGEGPAEAVIRDGIGRRGTIGAGVDGTDGPILRGPVPELAPTVEALARLMVVRAADLGYDPDAEAAAAAEATLARIAHRQLLTELAATEAGVAERQRLALELQELPTVDAPGEAEAGPARRGRRRERNRGTADPDGPTRARTSPTDLLAPGRGRRRAGGPGDPPPADRAQWARSLRRRQATLTARLAELPTEDDRAAAQRRVRATGARLRQLEDQIATSPTVDRVRNVLIGRAAGLRPKGVDCAVPLVLDDPLVGLDPGPRCDLLDVLARIADRTQLVLLTGDTVAAAWARQRAARGEVRLVEFGTIALS